MGNISKKIRETWRLWSAGGKLLAINVVVFAVMHIGAVICSLADLDTGVWLGMWAMPADIQTLALRPWTILVYMFAQYDVLHLLFNMLWLYGFARVFLMLSGGRQLYAVYIYCGLAGAACFIAGNYLFAGNGVSTASLLGSSASVMGIIAAAATLYPDMPLRMMFIGDVKLKWIAVATLVLFVLTSVNSPSGSMFAHIGGAGMGLLYGLQTRHGRNMTRGFDMLINFMHTVFKPRKKTYGRKQTPHFSPFKKSDAKKYRQKASTPQTEFTASDQAELDAILDKVKQSGYTGLTADEKKRLFEVSRRIK